ncbi:MAG TPA: divalent-cation tolerance protein CutA [Acidobacteriota bacterium]|jgi:periplasmic divalent cation tolerance protein|nr:divalent-cation tolerance protein CutA [Acidobacteriota bacterium]
MTDARVVLSTVDSGEVARDIARRLVEEHLAACVSLLPGLRSIYFWDGNLQDEPETLLVIKTGAACVDPLLERLKQLHPYQVPEMLVLSVETGSPDYLGWIASQTRP